MSEFGVLILLGFGDTIDSVPVHNETAIETPGRTGVDDSAVILAQRAADLLAAARLSPDVVFTPPRTNSIRFVNTLLCELHKLPRAVISDRRLDVEPAWPRARASMRRDRGYPDGWLSRTERPLDRTDAARRMGARWEDGDELEETDPADPTLFAAGVLSEFYSQRVVSFLLGRQTVLVIASPASIRGIRSTLRGDALQLGDELPAGQPLAYSFDRHLRPTPSEGRNI
ncbi:hypothetical protein E3O55_07670 [Cryobacterium sp. MDB1-18-2]|uniref:hypothetical protein n=1 Tax=unclassified Cryobacterium TaxID=2649013 RepID=UPI00106AEF22|nr:MULTISPECIES: hypothetical protein [unclassified Cryobacterium]TFB94411.1 hypothetical protein E3O39_14935 [Cryobacterium sp. MDB2-A-1]TFC08237.1 hypothetical protein E3O35_17795 [Cryobacterium sp. MDB2-A-2]TFC30625.1 hypothetical protein E3O55_07670 [Cryobacterium sp. MDB1-18-2]TFC41976.1 hypothetical protein E3O50_09420 [Cryobacterium sp. MDB1-18-1]